ncbi:alcohol dehydrogenase [Moniliophthora roreri MCA 2997]|uniref:Alcohol dehydrogenase n=2 Tax=Moniliophthora roreri TaxID=221103 RepID=V2XKJ2_MONRO|nr:alcohol dehydrogenase [Moniliophthora roreri MCA 2997]KAI3614238.1 alcohol dehydrogenase [Moniliophthora roreri]
MSTHKAIATISKGHFDVLDLSTPSHLKDDDVLIKNEYASMIAFDTYVNDLAYYVSEFPVVFGFNGSGTVAQVGKGVSDLKKGDRVTAFTFQGNAAKSMQEYSLVSRATVSKIPASLSLASAATIPDNFITAFNTLFSPLYLGFPIPQSFPVSERPPLADAPILIYGAGSTTGQYAIQLLKSAGYRNVIATASSRHHKYLQELGAKSVFDYSSPSLVEDIARASSSSGGKVEFAVDCITAEGTLSTISKVVSSQGAVALLLPVKKGNKVRGGEGEEEMVMTLPDDSDLLPKGTKIVGVRTFLYLENEYLRDNLMTSILPELLEAGIIQPNKVRLLDESVGSLKDRVATGLDLLRNNKVSGEKVVIKL